MIRLTPVAVFAALGVVLAGPAGAQRIQVEPGFEVEHPRPAPADKEVADQTLGMALMSATVESDGTLVRGAGVASSFRSGTGNYDVRFSRSVADCTCTASLGASGSAVAYSAQNFISANCPFGASGNVRVWIKLNGVDANYPFHLIVFCPK